MTAPGWYPDGQGNTRYWNGQGWAEDAAPAATEQMPPYSPPPPVPVGAPGHRVEGRKMPLWQPIGLGVLILLGGIGIGAAAGKGATKTVAGPTTTATATATVQSTVTSTPTVIKTIATKSLTATITFTPPVTVAFTDGTFLVGKEIHPGLYHSDGTGGSNCYFERDNSGYGVGKIIENGTVSGPTTITVQSSDYSLSTSGGCAWTRTG